MSRHRRSVLGLALVVLLTQGTGIAFGQEPGDEPVPGPSEPGEPGMEPAEPASQPRVPAPVVDKNQAAVREDPRTAKEPPVPAPSPVAPAPAPSPMAPSPGFLIKVALPVANAAFQTDDDFSTSLGIPTVLLGGISGMGLGGGLGIQYMHISFDWNKGYNGDEEESFHTVLFAPTVVYIAPGLAGGRVRFSGAFSPVLGFMGDEDDATAEFIAGYRLAVGGTYFFHPSFGLGVETGIAGLFLTDSDLGYNFLYGALTAMVILGPS